MPVIQKHSGALQGYRFQHVGRVLGLIRGILQYFVQFLNLDKSNGVLLLVEQKCNRAPADAIRFISRRFTSTVCQSIARERPPHPVAG